MTPPVRHLFHGLAAILAAAAVLSLAFAARVFLGGAREPAEAPAAAAPTAPAAAPADPLAGLAEVLAPAAPADPGALARRFRLAGVVLGGDSPMAILDDRVAVRQSIATLRAEVAPGVVLVAVRADGATLAGPDGEEDLAIERAAPRAAAPAAKAAEAGGAAPPPPEPGTRAAAAARFGGYEDFPGRWVYDKRKVLDYYEELRAEPERLLQIFDSMDPVYVDGDDGERRIDGYVVGVEGEAELFAAAGLKDGDIVKSVNNLAMTRRDRAERMIAAFVEGHGTMFVLEIERDGRTFKQVIDFE